MILLLSIVAQLLGVDRLLGQGGFWGLLIFAGLIASAAFIAGMAVKRVGRPPLVGFLVAHVLHAEHIEMIQEVGGDETYLTMQEAGLGRGERVGSRLDEYGAGPVS